MTAKNNGRYEENERSEFTKADTGLLSAHPAVHMVCG